MRDKTYLHRIIEETHHSKAFPIAINTLIDNYKVCLPSDISIGILESIPPQLGKCPTVYFYAHLPYSAPPSQAVGQHSAWLTPRVWTQEHKRPRCFNPTEMKESYGGSRIKCGMKIEVDQAARTEQEWNAHSYIQCPVNQLIFNLVFYLMMAVASWAT